MPLRARRPIRPYKSYSEYCKNHQWQCQSCFGRGDKVAPGEICDPVEGYKFANRVPCKKCGGTGELSDVENKKSYKWAVKQWRVEYDEYQRVSHLFGIMNTLFNEQDIKLISKHINW